MARVREEGARREVSRFEHARERSCKGGERTRERVIKRERARVRGKGAHAKGITRAREESEGDEGGRLCTFLEDYLQARYSAGCALPTITFFRVVVPRLPLKLSAGPAPGHK